MNIDYTPVFYYSANLTLGEVAAVTCSITTDTTYTDETVDCSGEAYSVSNSAAVNFVNSNLTADNITIEDGSKIVKDTDSILKIE